MTIVKEYCITVLSALSWIMRLHRDWWSQVKSINYSSFSLSYSLVNECFPISFPVQEQEVKYSFLVWGKFTTPALPALLYNCACGIIVLEIMNCLLGFPHSLSFLMNLYFMIIRRRHSTFNGRLSWSIVCYLKYRINQSVFLYSCTSALRCVLD